MGGQGLIAAPLRPASLEPFEDRLGKVPVSLGVVVRPVDEELPRALTRAQRFAEIQNLIAPARQQLPEQAQLRIRSRKQLREKIVTQDLLVDDII